MRDIMVRAHEIARTLEGNYSARMSFALRQAWEEARVLAAGGRRWERYGRRRLYLNGDVMEKLFGGFDGFGHSKYVAEKEFYDGSFWYCMVSGKFQSRGIRKEWADMAITRIKTVDVVNERKQTIRTRRRSTTRSVNRHPGYCYTCDSYCYGDCAANAAYV